MFNLEKYKHISFDLDGTLVHTVEAYRQKVVPETVKKLGGHVRDPKAVDRFWFESGRDAIIAKEFKLEPHDFWVLFRKFDTVKERSEHTFPYADAEMAIRKLKNSGKIISIITGAPQWIADMEIKKLNGIPYDLQISITSSRFKQKPDPESLHFAIKELNQKPEETLYIGNSNEDAGFAQNAGVDFLYLERREHEFNLGKYSIGTIHSLEELV